MTRLSDFRRMAVSSVFVLSLLFSSFSYALTFTVTDAGDSGPGTLRDAIAMANANVNAPTVDVIDFNIPLPATITLTTGEIPITEDLTIQGPGSDMLTISGNNNSRMLSVDGGSVFNVNDLRFINGNGDGAVIPGVGGAILLNIADLMAEFNRNVFEFNSVSCDIVVGTDTSGGAIANNGFDMTTTINETHFTSNTAVCGDTSSDTVGGAPLDPWAEALSGP